MRIATAFRYDSAVDSLQRRQRDLADAEKAMTTGKRIAVPSDDPVGAARAERALAARQRIESSQRSVEASRSAMTLAEGALGQANDMLQEAREALVLAGNGSFTAGERSAKAQQLTQLRSQLLALSNQGNGAGGYLFGGQDSGAAPFSDTAAGVGYGAAPGDSGLSLEQTMPSTVDGRAIWLSAPRGNGVFVTGAAAANAGTAWIDAGGVSNPSALTGDNYSVEFTDNGGTLQYSVLRNGQPTALSDVAYRSGQTISVDGMSFTIKGQPAAGDGFTMTPATRDLSPFEALDSAIATLQDPNANAGAIAQAVNSGLRDLDAVMGHIQAARAEVGATLSRLEAVDGRNQDRALWAKSVQSEAEDIDMVQAISEFQNQQTGYQAALQSYATVQRMSLFDYVK